GCRNPFVTRSARRLGYTVFGWTFGVWDSDPRVSAGEIRRRVARKLRPGAIILLHDGDGYDPAGDRRRTAEALPGIVADARAAGYVFRPLAPQRWRVAQEANLVGAAVNDLSVAVAGEAARVHVIAQRGGVPVAAALSSVVWTRVAEALALALFLVMAPSVLALESWLRALQVGVGLTLVIVLLLAWARGWAWLADQLPDSLQSRLAVLRSEE